MVAFLFLVIAAVIAITQGVRKISVQYAKRVVGRKMYGGQSTYMPLKVNYAGVMPIIFAWALLLFPTTIVGFLFKNSRMAKQITDAMASGWPHYVLIAAMIFFFSYFWVATQFQPSQIADDLKKHGGYIPGVRPGKPTADFLDYTRTRLTVAGAVFRYAGGLQPWGGSGAGHVDVAIRRDRCSRHQWGCDFPLRPLSEETACSARRARFWERYPG